MNRAMAERNLLRHMAGVEPARKKRRPRFNRLRSVRVANPAAPVVFLVLAGIILVILGAMQNQPAAFWGGALLAWLAGGPIGVAVIASRQGREPAVWGIFAVMAPFLALLAVLVVGRKDVRIRGRDF